MLTATEPPPKPRTFSVGKKADGSKATAPNDTAARLRKQKRDEIKNSAPNPEKAQKQKPKSASRKNPARPDGILDTVDADGNWTYVFGQDNMSGDKLGACITLRAKPWHDEPQDMECITKVLELQEGFRSTLKNDSPDDPESEDAPANELDSIYANNEQEIKDAYANAMACLNPCLKQGYEGKDDLQFLYDCVDWGKVRETWQKGDRGEISSNTLFEEKSPYACTEDALLKGAREGRYQAWTRDPKTGACVRCAKPGWHWSETERRCVICEKNEHWDSKNLKCVTCPRDLLWDEHSNACVHCMKPGERWSETEKRCVICEKDEHWSAKEGRCWKCEPTEHWDARKQVCEGCPDGLSWAPWARACVHCPNPLEHWSEKKQQCTACAKGEDWDAKTQACVHWHLLIDRPIQRPSPPPSPTPSPTPTPILTPTPTPIPSPIPSPKPVDLGQRLREDFDKTHECPKDPADFKNLNSLVSKLTAQGYPREVLPMGSKSNPNLVCGYLTGYGSTQDSVHCTDSLTCYMQGNKRLGYPPDCNKLVRKSVRESLFIMESSCSQATGGPASWHEGGDGGDMRLIPIGPRIWIVSISFGAQIWYTGYVFGN